MNKEELEIMIYAYRPSIEESEKDSVLAFMVAAYNRAIDDAFDRVWDILEVGGPVNYSDKDKLKIK